VYEEIAIMAIWDFRPKADIWTGLAIAAALLAAPVVVPVVAAAVRPVLKAALKGSILVFERGRETIAEIGEVVEDLFEEAKAEARAELTSCSDEEA
jgi:hypothetical protein